MFTGRVVRPGQDPAWLDTDRELALAWEADRRATCRCGTRPDEWADDDDAYISSHVYCEGCARLAEEQNGNIPRDPDGNPRPGFHAYLVPRELYRPPDDENPRPRPDDD